MTPDCDKRLCLQKLGVFLGVTTVGRWTELNRLLRNHIAWDNMLYARAGVYYTMALANAFLPFVSLRIQGYWEVCHRVHFCRNTGALRAFEDSFAENLTLTRHFPLWCRRHIYRCQASCTNGKLSMQKFDGESPLPDKFPAFALTIYTSDERTHFILCLDSCKIPAECSIALLFP